MTATKSQEWAAARVRACKAEIESPGYRGDYLGHAALVVREATEWMRAADVVALCRAVAGVGVRGRAAAERELRAYCTELPRTRDSQRV